MVLVSYDRTATMKQARERYFAANEFGDDGGYGDAWVDFKLAKVPFPFPNSAERVRALRYHDLHHILTGYDTDWRGEVEIAAWEIGAGCRDFYAAWVLNLSALGSWWFAPRRVFDAWKRGRRSASLYGLAVEPLLEQTVEQTRAQMHVPEGATDATARDVASFAVAVCAGTIVGLALFAIALPLAPFGVLALRLAKPQPKPAH